MMSIKLLVTGVSASVVAPAAPVGRSQTLIACNDLVCISLPDLPHFNRAILPSNLTSDLDWHHQILIVEMWRSSNSYHQYWSTEILHSSHWLQAWLSLDKKILINQNSVRTQERHYLTLQQGLVSGYFLLFRDQNFLGYKKWPQTPLNILGKIVRTST